MRPLPHPPEAEEHADSIEVLRGWIVEGELHVSIAPCWEWREQPADWGRLLAQAAAQMAEAISNETGKDRAEIWGYERMKSTQRGKRSRRFSVRGNQSFGFRREGGGNGFFQRGGAKIVNLSKMRRSRTCWLISGISG